MPLVKDFNMTKFRNTASAQAALVEKTKHKIQSKKYINLRYLLDEVGSGGYKGKK